MASILRVNTLTDASSNNSVAMSTVAGGSAKSHNRFNFDGNTVTGSFNQSSVSDIGTGEYQATYTNNMSNANYTIMIWQV